MGSVDILQTSFTTGEISPFALGRVDLTRYPHAVEELTNYIIMPLGGIRKRPGTKFAGKAKTGATAVPRFKKFQFSTTQAYLLEFSNLKIRIYKDNGIVTQTAQNITGITKANPAVVTYSGSDTYANGDIVYITGVVGMTQVNDLEFTVANVNTGANTFELSGIDSSAYTTYSSGGIIAEIVEITTTYTEAELFKLNFAQSADTLYITHPDHAPASLTRSSHTSWTLADLAIVGGPFMLENSTAVTMDASAVTGSITITASSASFASTDVGRFMLIEYVSVADFIQVEITGFTDTTHVNADVIRSAGLTHAATTHWYWGSWSDTSGYPSCVTFHQERLCFANTVSEPQTVWLSTSQSFLDFYPYEDDMSVIDDNAITVHIASNEVNAINWMISYENLMLGSLSAINELSSAADNRTITPSSVEVRERVFYGSLSLTPIKVGTGIIFADRSGRALRRVTREEVALDAFKADDISILAEHLLREGDSIKQIAYQQNPYSTIWVLCTSGQLFGMTYDQYQDVIGWFRYVPGGTLTGASMPTVETIEVIPTVDGEQDQLWLSVKRTMNSATVRSVEYMNAFFDPADATERDDMYFLDAGATYDSTATTTITGLGFAKGETFSIVADGIEVTAQAITIDRVTISSASVVHLGYEYNAQGKTLPPEAGNPKGAASGKLKRIDHVTFRVVNSLMLKAGRDYDNLFSLHGFTEATGDLVTDDIRIPIGQAHSRRGQFVFRQDKPYESIILCLMPELTVTQQ